MQLPLRLARCTGGGGSDNPVAVVRPRGGRSIRRSRTSGSVESRSRLGSADNLGSADSWARIISAVTWSRGDGREIVDGLTSAEDDVTHSADRPDRAARAEIANHAGLESCARPTGADCAHTDTTDSD